MDSKKSCKLCGDFADDFVDISQDFEDSTIDAILTKHFRFQIAGSSDYLCQTCWTNTKNFHIFYNKIQKTLPKIHFDERNTVDLYENQTANSNTVCKQEPSLSLMDAVEEANEFIVKTEEINPWIVFDLHIQSEESFGANYDPGEDNQSSDDEMQTGQLSLGAKYQKNTPPFLHCWKPGEDKQVSNDEPSPKMVEKPQNNNVCESEKSKLGHAHEWSLQFSNTPTKKRRKRVKTNNTNRFRDRDNATEDAQIREFCDMKCEICCDQFETFAEAKTHYRIIHKTGGYVTCCQQKFTQRCNALDHIQLHLHPEKFKCDICTKNFADKSSLKNHLENHGPRAHKCDLCSSSFTREWKLVYHKRRQHCSEEDKKFHCNQCNKKFALKSSLNFHIRSKHELAYAQVCDVCAKVFPNRPALQRHMDTQHSTVFQPELECKACGKWMQNEKSLRAHMKRHQDRPSCSICNKVLQSQNSLSNHIRLTHGEKRFKCTECGKAYKKGLLLKEHIAAKHTGEVLYKCQYCSKPFKSYSNLHDHRKKEHFTEWTRDKLKPGAPTKERRIAKMNGTLKFDF